jgi:hypothetical protein
MTASGVESYDSLQEADITSRRRPGMNEQTNMETIKVEGGQLIDQIKRLIHEGNVRRITIKQDDRTVVEFPLTVGVIGVVLAPVLAAVGALAALLAECTIEIERFEDAPVGTAAPTMSGGHEEDMPTVELTVP